MTSKSLRTVVAATLLFFLVVSPCLAQREQAPPGGSAEDPAGASQGATGFETRNGIVVSTSVEEKALYFTEEGSDEQFKVILDDKAKIKIDKKKGGLEMLEMLTEGMTITVTVSTLTGEATTIKAKAAKKS